MDGGVLSPPHACRRAPSPLAPLPKGEGRKRLHRWDAAGEDDCRARNGMHSGGLPHPWPLSQRARGESDSSVGTRQARTTAAHGTECMQACSLTPGPSPKGRGGKATPPLGRGRRGRLPRTERNACRRAPSPPAPLPKGEGRKRLRRWDGAGEDDCRARNGMQSGGLPHPWPLSQRARGESASIVGMRQARTTAAHGNGGILTMQLRE